MQGCRAGIHLNLICHHASPAPTGEATTGGRLEPSQATSQSNMVGWHRGSVSPELRRRQGRSRGHN